MADEDYEKTMQIIEAEHKIQKEAGCHEIYRTLIIDIIRNKGRNLEKILKEAPAFEIDLPCGCGQTLLMYITSYLPGLSPSTFALFLKRKPNPLIRREDGKSAQDILKTNRSSMNPDNETNSYILNSMLEDYKMEYIVEKKLNARLQSQPIYQPIAHQSALVSTKNEHQREN